MRDDLTMREIIIADLLKTGESDVHVEDITEVVAGCVDLRLTIKLEPFNREYVKVSI